MDNWQQLPPTPPPGFGTNGSVVPPFPGGLSIDQYFVDVGILTSGKLLASATLDTGTAAAIDMGVMRLHADGSLDITFGSGGKATAPFDRGATPARRADQAVKIIVLGGGRFVLGGIATTASGGLTAIARLAAGGVLDTAGDGDGKRPVHFGGGPADVGIAYNLLASVDNERVYGLGTSTQAGNCNCAIARLLGDGSLDATSAGNGTITYAFDIGGSLGDGGYESVGMPDGKLLLCGIRAVLV